MRISFLLAFMMLSLSHLHANQPELHLKHQKRSRTKIIKEGRRIKVSTLGGALISGKFMGHDSEHIFLENDTVLLSEVQYLQIRPQGSQAVGWGIAGIGTSIMAGGALVIREAFYSGTTAAVIILGFGVLIMGSGIIINSLSIPLILNSKRYHIRDGGKWRLVP